MAKIVLTLNLEKKKKRDITLINHLDKAVSDFEYVDDGAWTNCKD